MREITYVQAIKEATQQVMQEDPNVILIGEGVPDPKAIFASTSGLQQEFGDQRVFDMPVSENGMTGVCIGAAIRGVRPILVHQRIDFSLYAMDQLVNNAAKWSSMFGGQAGSCPLVVRCIVGRGWGAGNQHSQNLAHLYATIPGLQVLCPASALDAKEMLVWACRQNNPVMFIEHRWLHNTVSVVPERIQPKDKITARFAHYGQNITIVSWSYMVIECIAAAQLLKEFCGISCDVIDMRSIRPLDMRSVKASLNETKRLLVVEEAWKYNGLASEIITQVSEDENIHLIERPQRLNLPDCYAPSTPHLTKNYYPTYKEIALKVLDMVPSKPKARSRLMHALATQKEHPHDVPDPSFKGPF